MKQQESIQEFYKRVNIDNALVPQKNGEAGHINVFARDNCASISPYSRRDFYKVSLIIGTGRLHFANKWIYIDRPALLFSNPIIPYSWEAESVDQQGWFCLFTETFIQHTEKSIQESPVFKIGADPVYFLDEPTLAEVSTIFKKMIAEIGADYAHKYSVLRNYLNLIIHCAMKLQPTTSFIKQLNASSRISNLFLELLERQFPIDSPDVMLRIKTAQQFAQNLSVHVNHLNRSVKEITGKTTTEHIANRMVQEACALLEHSDWDVAEIGYSLSFEHPSNFNMFFKKHKGQSPNQYRKEIVSYS